MMLICGLFVFMIVFLRSLYVDDESSSSKIFGDTLSLSILPEYQLELSRMESIPPILHISWWDKRVMETHPNNAIIRNGLANFKRLNPEWDIQISNDSEIDQYLQAKLSGEEYAEIADRHIVEKADLWRLLKVYYEGGVYMDLDRLYNVPMDQVLGTGTWASDAYVTKLILPLWSGDPLISFTQDFLGSAKGNSLFKNAIDDNIESRRQCRRLVMTGPYTYRVSVLRTLFGSEMADWMKEVRDDDADDPDAVGRAGRLIQQIYGVLQANQYVISGVESFYRCDSIVFHKANWKHAQQSMAIEKEFDEAKEALHQHVGHWIDENKPNTIKSWTRWIRCQINRLSPI